MYEPVENEFTIVHAAAKTQKYEVMFYFIEHLNFQVDYFKPRVSQMTLLHIIARYHTSDYTEKDKTYIRKLIGMSNNLLLRNNFGKTILQVGE